MKTTDINIEGLSHEYQLFWSAEEIDTEVDKLVLGRYKNANIPGFRPGKVPFNLLKKRFGQMVLPEALDHLFELGRNSLVEEKGLEDVVNFNSVPEDYKPGGDLIIRFEVDIRPQIEPMDFSKISLVEYKTIASEASLEEALKKLAQENRPTKEVEKAAKTGDALEIDFEGFLDGEAFEGGKAENTHLEIGVNRFIPGFEEKFIGAKSGDQVDFEIDFPEDYGADNLKGQTALFRCKVNKVMQYEKREINDELAKELGLDDLAALKERLKADYSQQFAQQTEEKLQIELMDAIDAAHDFALPIKMVDREFENIWPQIQQALENGHLDPEDAGKDEETLRTDYRKIAERRVRLGLIMHEVAKRGQITVTEEDTRTHMVRRISEMQPAQQQQMIGMLSRDQDRERLNNMFNAELLENKTILFIKEQANVTVEEISEEKHKALFETDHNHDHEKEEKPKKKAAKKTAATKTPAKKAPAKKAPAKKEAAKKETAKKK